ncbi:MAG: NusG domain II-containing protein [Eubacteriales bacterium]|nr:NusG domain II-containing protein [Eubacteriales bacterium]
MDKKRRNSFILGAVCILAASGAGIAAKMGREQGSQVIVFQDGAEQGRYLLSEEQDVEIALNQENQEGKNILRIRDGSADMIYADCPDQLCVNQKEIDKVGETIVCLPHKIVVEVEGEKQSDFDSIAN